MVNSKQRVPDVHGRDLGRASLGLARRAHKGTKLQRDKVAVLLCAFVPVCLCCAAPPEADLRRATINLKTTVEQEVAALKKEEMRLVETLMRQFPDSVDAILLTGNVHAGHGDTVGAFEFWKKALEREPRRADVYHSMGRFAMAKGQYQEAINHWRKALEIDPQISGVHNGIARALMGLGKQAEAIEELKKDIQVSPDSSFSYFLLGQGYLQEKEYEKAKDNYAKAIALQPNLTNAYYGLFTVCSRLGQQAEAKKYMALFRKLKAEDMKVLKDRNDARDDAAAMQKNAAETYMRAGRIYQAKGKMAEAEQLLKRAAALDTENSIYLMRLASLYQMTNRTADALQMHKRISELEPDNPVCYLNIGSASAQLKRFDAAEEAFRRAIALAPKSSDGYRELATLYLQMGKMVPQARALAEKAVALEPTAANYSVLSWACDKNGDTANALSAIKRAVELEPNNQRYQRIYQLIRKRK
jgi:protein O-GlcNAc transferase